MKKICRYIKVSALMACVAVFASHAYASVCFLPTGDCGDSKPAQISIDTEKLKDQCNAEGYTTPRSECVFPKNPGGTCPYDNKWVICCDPEFNYTSGCVHPLKQDARCGNRYKCKCDDMFKYYMQSVNNASICTKYGTSTTYPGAYVSGNYCSLEETDEEGETTKLLLHEQCLCDLGTYPKTDQICENEEEKLCGGSLCKGSDGVQRCTTCRCSDEFSVRESSCTYGIYKNSKVCIQSGERYVKQNACCSCPDAEFPYESVPDSATVKRYASCASTYSCTGGRSGSVYKALECQDGYKLTAGNRCVEVGCADAIEDYIDAGLDNTVSLYKPGVSSTDKTKNKIIVADDTGYGARWSDFYGKEVMSGAYYASKLKGADLLTKTVKKRCTQVPTITISGDMTSTGSLNFTSVNLVSGSSWWNKGGFTCTNCSMDIFAYHNEADTDLRYDESNTVNADNMIAEFYGIEIKTSGADFRSHGYDISVGNGNFELKNFPTSNVDMTGAATLGVTSNFVPNNSVVISGDASRRIKFEMPGGSSYNLGYMKINGGMVFNYADVYVKNAYIGPKSPQGDNTKCSNSRCTNCNCYLRSFINTYNTNWYLHDDNNNRYTMYLGPGSYIGVPSGNTTDPFNRNVGSKIILFTAANYGSAIAESSWITGITSRLQRRNSENDRDCWGGGYKEGNTSKESLSQVTYLTSSGVVSRYSANYKGYSNPICVGIGHHDSRYNVIIKWSGVRGSTYPKLIDGGIPVGLNGNHGCVACVELHSPYVGSSLDQFGYWTYTPSN